MAGIAAPNIVKDGLVFLVDPINTRSWTGPDSSTVNDLIDNNSCEIYNDTSGSYGSNQSFAFDKVDDHINTNTNYTKFDGTSEITLNFWVKVINNGLNGYICSVLGGNFFSFGFSLNNGNVFYCRIDNASNRARSWGIFDNTIKGDGLWHNITGTLDLNQSSEFQAYLDTEPVTNMNGFYQLTSLPSSTSPLYIGTRDNTNTFNFGGEIGPLQLYNRVLSTQEIKQNYNALKGRFGL